MRNLLIAPILLLSLATFAQAKRPAHNLARTADLSPHITCRQHNSPSWIGNAHLQYRTFVTKITTPEFIQKKGITTAVRLGVAGNKNVTGKEITSTALQPNVSLKVGWRF